MATFTQSAQTLMAHDAHTHSNTDVSIIGSALDVKTSLTARVYIFHANVETTANATGVDYIIQGNWNTTVDTNEDWVDLFTFRTGTTAAVAAEIAGNEAAGQTSITVDADPTAAFTRGINVYIQDTGTVNDGEWGRCDHSIASTDVFLVDGLTNAKDAADTIWTQAETYTSDILNLSGCNFIRLLILHTASTGSNLHFKAELVEVTAIA